MERSTQLPTAYIPKFAPPNIHPELSDVLPVLNNENVHNRINLAVKYGAVIGLLVAWSVMFSEYLDEKKEFQGTPFEDDVQTRMSRRAFLSGGTGFAVGSLIGLLKG